MISFHDYKKLYSDNIGRARKHASDVIMDATFKGDIGYQIGYFYDWYHDLNSDDKNVLRGLNSAEDPQKIPIEIKYQAHTQQTFSKDQITYHIQFRPLAECGVDYYPEAFGKYNATYPVGLYVDIEDNNGQRNRWLVVGTANFPETQFSTYEILPCDYVFQWIMDNKKISMPGVLRSQNSYNSGVWRDYLFQSVEDQQKFILPLNSESEKIYYNKRMIIDNRGIETEPRAWQVSKVNRLSSNGTVMVTLAQGYFDQNNDYIEHDVSGKIVGMWADYYKNGVGVPNQSGTNATIEYKGAQNDQIKVGGNARTFFVTFFNDDGTESEFISGAWSYTIDGDDASSLVTASSTTADNEVKVKFIGDDSYIGKDLVIKYTVNTDVVAEITMNISGL